MHQIEEKGWGVIIARGAESNKDKKTLKEVQSMEGVGSVNHFEDRQGEP